MKGSISKRNTVGFTLIELLITIAVGAIIISMAASSFNEVIYSTKLKTARGMLVNALRVAQHQAQYRSIPVALCPSKNTSTCATSWSEDTTGWLVYEDHNRDGDLDSTDNIIAIEQKIKVGNIKIVHGDTAITTPQVLFIPTGHKDGEEQSEISLCSESDETNIYTVVKISTTGKVKYENIKVGTGDECN